MSTTTLGHVPLRGRLNAIGCKSDAHRALICSMLCGEPTEILGLPEGLDVCSTARCLEALGCQLREDGDVTRVIPGKPDAEPVLNCGESVSALRLLLPAVAGLPGCDPTFTGRGRLPERPLEPLLRTLSAHGLQFDAERLPLRMEGIATGGVYRLSGEDAGQFVSGLLLLLGRVGGELRPEGTAVTPGYTEMTRRIMRCFGVKTDGLSVEKQVYRSPGRYALEGDWFTAAVWLAAGALGGEVSVDGLRPDSLQPDTAILSFLSRMGADVTQEEGQDGICRITARAGQLRGIQCCCSGCPDIAPVVMALASAADGESEITGLEVLRQKEGDRLAASVSALRALGADLFTDGGTIRIRGRSQLEGGTVDCMDDYRIAMAVSALSCRCRQPVILRGAECVERNDPHFFEDYAALGGEME